jgi:hypothetical protein
MRFDPENHEGIDIDKITKIVSPETDFILHKKKYKPTIGKHWVLLQVKAKSDIRVIIWVVCGIKSGVYLMT